MADVCISTQSGGGAYSPWELSLPKLVEICLPNMVKIYQPTMVNEYLHIFSPWYGYTYILTTVEISVSCTHHSGMSIHYCGDICIHVVDIHQINHENSPHPLTHCDRTSQG